MTVSVRPGIATFAAEGPATAALPQTDLLSINIDQIPLLKDALAPASTSSAARLTPGTGGAHGTMAPGCAPPHTGTAEVYTFSGC
jgi:hypothetical protein